MNEAWLSGRIDELGRFFAPDVIIAPPGDRDRIIGREAVVESFRHNTEQAITHRFDELDLRVDVTATVAVAVLRFSIRYEIGGATYEETGRDIFVMAPSEGSWRIIWRTQIGEEAKEGSLEQGGARVTISPRSAVEADSPLESPGRSPYIGEPESGQ